MIRLPDMGEGSCSVSIRDVCINMIKSIVSSFRARIILIKFGESCSQIGMIEITSNN